MHHLLFSDPYRAFGDLIRVMLAVLFIVVGLAGCNSAGSGGDRHPHEDHGSEPHPH